MRKIMQTKHVMCCKQPLPYMCYIFGGKTFAVSNYLNILIPGREGFEESHSQFDHSFTNYIPINVIDSLYKSSNAMKTTIRNVFLPRGLTKSFSISTSGATLASQLASYQHPQCRHSHQEMASYYQYEHEHSSASCASFQLACSCIQIGS